MSGAACTGCAARLPRRARWCPACGDPVGRAVRTTVGRAADRERRRRRVGLVAGAASLVAVAWLLAPGPDAATDPDGPTELVQRWRVGGAMRAADQLDADVRALGPDHVLVGRRVVATGAAATGGARRLPASLVGVAVGEDGAWAVAEAGLVVRGRVGADGTTFSPVRGGDWRPVGPALAWVGAAAVFDGTDGRLGAVAPDGAVRWTTARPVRPTGTSGAGVLVVVGGTGRPAVLDPADGGLRPLPDGLRPEVVVGTEDGPVVVARRADEVVGVVAATGEVRWRRAAELGGRWDAAGSTLLRVSSRLGAVAVDPADGRDRWASPAVAAVAVGDGAVVRDADGGDLVGVDADGGVRWRVPVDQPGAVHLRVDERRVAVVSAGPRGPRFAVVDAATGRVVAEGDGDDRLPRPVRPVRAVLDGAVGIAGTRLPDGGGLGWVVAATGGDGREVLRAALPAGLGPGDLRVVGAVDDGGDRVPLVLVEDTAGTAVRAGRLGPVRVPLPADAVRPGPADGVAAAVPGGGTTVVDLTAGTVAEVPGVVPGPVVGGLRLAARPGPAGSPPRTVALDPGSGSLRWEVAGSTATGLHGPGPLHVGPLGGVGGPGVVEVGTTVLMARSAQDGAQRWTRVMPAPVSAEPVTVVDRVLVPLADGTVRVVAARDGADLGFVPDVGGVPVVAAPSGDGGVLVGTDDGRVVRLSPDGRTTGSWRVGDRAVMDLVVVDDVVVVVTVRTVVGLGPDDGTVAERDRVEVVP